MDELLKRLLEIQARVGSLNAQADLSDSELDEMEALAEEGTKLERKIEARKRADEIVANAGKSNRQVASTPNAPAATPRVIVSESKDDLRHGYKNPGEFYKAVAMAAKSNNMNVDDRLRKYSNAAVEKIGEDGGFLIPPDFRSEIQKKISGDESLLPKTRQFRTSSNNVIMPINETAPWDGTGVQAYWEGEAKQYTQSKEVFGEAAFRLHKLTSLVPVTEELLQDAPLLESFLATQAPEAMVHKINSAIINGSGVGIPHGFMKSGFKFKVAKEGGQAADTILFENIVNMQARILPASFNRSIWLVNPQVIPQLRLMSFKAGAASPVPAYLPPSGLAEAPYGTLMGRPIMPMMGAVKALGDEGDIQLVDLSYYFSLLKTDSITHSISTHLWFDQDLVAFKYSFRMGGQVPFKTPVTTENGAFAMSGIVTLEDR
jgi:HK97 family phage major capsid protein